jgi:predicted ester cyclase
VLTTTPRSDPRRRQSEHLTFDEEGAPMLRQAFPDLHAVIHDQAVDGDKVWTRKTFRATHLGEFMSLLGDQVSQLT